MLTRLRNALLDVVLAKYGGLLIPWIALYEYLYGYVYAGSDFQERKRFVEELGTIVWPNQRTLLRTLELDVSFSENCREIPLLDLSIATTA
jgi:predicted nucleic acid-binding protein